MGAKKGRGFNGKPGPGRPKGSKNQRTKHWEALRDKIVGQETERFAGYMEDLFEKNPDEWAKLYMRVLDYFKPRLQRREVELDADVGVEFRVTRADH